MISFINTFLSYLILVVISMAVIVAGVFCGKKLRDAKDKKEAASDAGENSAAGE